MKPIQQCLENCGVLPSGFPGHGKDPSKVTEFKPQWDIEDKQSHLRHIRIGLNLELLLATWVTSQFERYGINSI
jgi:hypothetical protein